MEDREARCPKCKSTNVADNADADGSDDPVTQGVCLECNYRGEVKEFFDKEETHSPAI